MPATSAHRPSVLVVEIDENVRNLLYVAFRQAGFKVVLASSDERAVKLYKGMRSGVAAVLVSAERHRLNGCRLLAALQKVNPAIRCVIATGVTPDDEILPLVRQGAAGLLCKPLDAEEAVSLVSQVMEGDWIVPARHVTRRRPARCRARATSRSGAPTASARGR